MDELVAGPSPTDQLSTFAEQLNASEPFNTICLNMTLAVLHLRALLKGCVAFGIPDLPDQIELVHEAYGVRPDSNRRSYWAKKTPYKLGTALQMSALTTPMVLLLPNRLDNAEIKRDYMIEVSTLTISVIFIALLQHRLLDVCSPGK